MRSASSKLVKSALLATEKGSSSYTDAVDVDNDRAPPPHKASPVQTNAKSKGVVHSTDDTTYQSRMTLAEQDAMRRILAQRSSDLLPSKKGVVSLCETAHFGLLVNYACIGFLNGLFPSLIYPFFKLYLNMESYQVSAALMVIQLPWSYKTVFGILSDHYPIFGYRRKSYILIGWLICFIALMVLACSPHEDPYYASGEIHRTRNAAARVIGNPHAPKAGARYLIDIMFVCIGYVIADVACDGIMVELAQHEHIEVRGTAQSTIYIVRYSSNLVAGIVTALCFNGAEYGGSFSWSVSYHLVFYACGIITMLGAISTIFLLDEEPFPPDLLKHPFPEMWRIFKQRAIWQLMAFHFLNSFLSSFGFSGMASIQEYWAGIVPLNSSIASCVSTSLVVFATWFMRTYFLNASWRKMMLACSLFASAVNFSVNMIVTFDVERNQWFYLGGPQLAVVPDGMRHVISGFVTVEIAEHGFEGATYGLLTTVHNLATPCATSAYNFVDSFFDVADADIASDTTHVRHQVAYCLLIALTAQLLGLTTLKLLPKQKLHAQELKFHGRSSACAGLVALIVLLAALAWATTLNLLSIQSSTACLRIAGGRGC
ncbi:Folate-biopterin transporter, partial [Globisporangium splendens]